MNDHSDFMIKSEPQDSRGSDLDADLFDDNGLAANGRKQSHIAAEQKRRDAIKKGYDKLQTIVPSCKYEDDSKSLPKMSKAQVLQKSLEYMQFLLSEKHRQDEELVALEKEVKGLEIMKDNYEQMLQTSEAQVQDKNEVSEQEKITVFLKIINSMWISFRDSISVATFQMLSSTIFSWVEKYCKPQTLREAVVDAMRSTFSDKR